MFYYTAPPQANNHNYIIAKVNIRGCQRHCLIVSYTPHPTLANGLVALYNYNGFKMWMLQFLRSIQKMITVKWYWGAIGFSLIIYWIHAKMSEKLCLQWNDFKDNVSSSRSRNALGTHNVNMIFFCHALRLHIGIKGSHRLKKKSGIL